MKSLENITGQKYLIPLPKVQMHYVLQTKEKLLFQEQKLLQQALDQQEDYIQHMEEQL